MYEVFHERGSRMCMKCSIIHYTQKTVMTAHPTRTGVKCVSLFVSVGCTCLCV